MIAGAPASQYNRVERRVCVRCRRRRVPKAGNAWFLCATCVRESYRLDPLRSPGPRPRGYDLGRQPHRVDRETIAMLIHSEDEMLLPINRRSRD